MSLFQRIKTPFSDTSGDDAAAPRARRHAIGTLLRERREELGLDLDTIGDMLRIKPGYLAALEQGRAQDLPGPTYAIGFIRAYARHLGLDSERVLERYKAESSEVSARPDLSLPVPLGSRSIPGGPIVLVALILALCGYGTWFYLSTGERGRPERVAAVPSGLAQTVKPDAGVPIPAPSAPSTPSAAIAAPAAPRLSSGLSAASDAVPAAEPSAADPAAGNLAASHTATPLSSPSPTAAALTSDSQAAPPTPSEDAAAKSGQGIEIRALADCWIQVRSADDQSIVFSRVLKAGDTYRVPRSGLLLRTGNAGALAIRVDGKAAPAIGGIGTLRRSVSLDPDALLAGTAVHG